MRCGPVRYQVSAKQQALARPFDHYVTQRQTAFMMPQSTNTGSQRRFMKLSSIGFMMNSANQFILDDINKPYLKARSPIVLTERKSMCLLLAEQIKALRKMFL